MFLLPEPNMWPMNMIWGIPRALYRNRIPLYMLTLVLAIICALLPYQAFAYSTIDPDISHQSISVRYTQQKHVFTANGRIWYFWAEDTGSYEDAVWKTSSNNGDSWDSFYRIVPE